MPEQPRFSPDSNSEQKEKQEQLNKPKLKEILLKLHFQTLSEEESEKLLKASSERENTEQRMNERQALKAKVHEKIDDRLYKQIQGRFLGKGIEQLVIKETPKGYKYIHCNGFFSAQIWIVDGNYYGRFPGQETDAEFDSSDDAIVWYLQKLGTYHRATEK